MDYIWTIGYYLTLQNDGTSEIMFPSFYDSCVNEKNQSDSRVAAMFTRAFKSIRDLSEHYCDKNTVLEIESSIEEFSIKHLNSSAGFNAHGAKKLGIQTLGDLLTISIQDISMRGGWALKSFNTFFDYWVGSLPASVRTGKLIAGWRQVLGQGYHGGAPPTLDDIVDESDKVDTFVHQWLGYHQHVDLKLQRLLVANMLRHWEETKDVISKEPSGMYDNGNHVKHPFFAKVIEVCHYSGITEATFNGWVETVRNGFIKRNIVSMTKRQCEQVGYEAAAIDARSFLEVTESNSKQ